MSVCCAQLLSGTLLICHSDLVACARICSLCASVSACACVFGVYLHAFVFLVGAISPAVCAEHHCIRMSTCDSGFVKDEHVHDRFCE